MFTRISLLIFGSLFVAACQQAPGGPGTFAPAAPSSLAAAAPERPMHAQFLWTRTAVQPAPPGAPSTFNGRCSVPSQAIVWGAFEGEGTHWGRFHGASSHCQQLGRYSDGVISITTANGDLVNGTYQDGTIVGSAFHDTLMITGGTGRFEEATGVLDQSGEGTGTGNGVAFTLEGTIVYAAGRGRS